MTELAAKKSDERVARGRDSARHGRMEHARVWERDVQHREDLEGEPRARVPSPHRVRRTEDQLGCCTLIRCLKEKYLAMEYNIYIFA